MLELRQLRQFVVVAEELSFTRAARKIPIAQSALSASVRSLERQLHTELFRRTGHAVELTKSGEVLLVEARRILQAADDARDAVADVEGGVRGTVRVGILQALAFGAVSDVLAAFRADRPLVQIEVRVEPRGSAELLRAVQQGRLDLAFVALASRSPTDIDIVSLGSEPVAVVLPRDHRLAETTTIAIEDLDGETFVDYPEGWGIRQLIEQVFADRHLEREIAVEVADIPTATALARCGFGIAFVLPSAIASLEGEPHPTEPPLDLEISLISSKNPASRAATRAFVDVVQKQFGSTARRAGT
ncbi:MAG TPA: LysR family transcriptional regulator [Jatrophihabitans sp.]|nr:LysR family transcriptional regulator [Jatrophihabitans sp.]